MRRVMNAPMRIEEGVAPKTVAFMQPSTTSTSAANRLKRGLALPFSFTKSSVIKRETKPAWFQEIWVMVQDVPIGRKVISAWRYPGVSKVRSEIKDMMKSEYQSYLGKS